MDKKYTIAVDFDGVLHSYTSPFTTLDYFPDPPVEGAFEWLEEMTKHFKVVIHTCRLTAGRQPGLPKYILGRMFAWFTDHGLPVEVFQQLHFWVEPGKPKALVYIDDRGYRFTGDNFPSKDQIHRLRPWNKEKKNGT